MMTPIKLGLWIALAITQLAVPAWMIVGEERVLRQGRQLKLHTRPVDPADIFRGRYVALAFQIEQVPRERVRGELFDHGDLVYLELREGADGFGEVVALHKERTTGDLVLRATVNFITPEMIGVELPFSRYYMDENAAPDAEAAYRAAASDSLNTWVTVRIHHGRAVLEELYLNGRPVQEFIREHRRR